MKQPATCMCAPCASSPEDVGPSLPSSPASRTCPAPGETIQAWTRSSPWLCWGRASAKEASGARRACSVCTGVSPGFVASGLEGKARQGRRSQAERLHPHAACCMTSVWVCCGCCACALIGAHIHLSQHTAGSQERNARGYCFRLRVRAQLVLARRTRGMDRDTITPVRVPTVVQCRTERQRKQCTAKAGGVHQRLTAKKPQAPSC